MTDSSLHSYRTHRCGDLRADDVGKQVRLSGWIHRKRDHGGLVFIDLRDHYGLTQIVADSSDKDFATLDHLRVESVLCVTGLVVARSVETINPRLPTGDIELRVEQLSVLSPADEMPLPVAGEADYPEDIRLKYRFIDLRREQLHRNITLRADVVASLRRRMIAQGFTEYQTPILTASSPEGARDYLVPSRTHPGKFYALPQAPQMFKQLLMAAGFDRYFQIAPCFRDEDARADRSPGEFYQLDFEMSFVTQEDVFAAIEPVLAGVFEEFADYHSETLKESTPPSKPPKPSSTTARSVTKLPFPRLSYNLAMQHFGSDKPDLRNPLHIQKVTDIFEGSGFGMFANMIAEKNAEVHAIRVPNAGEQSRKFFEDMNLWVRGQGFAGLGYINFKNGKAGGPIAKNIGEERVGWLDKEMQKFAAKSKDWQAFYKDSLGTYPQHFSADMPEPDVGENDGIFFACGTWKENLRLLGLARTELANRLNLIDQNRFDFCWIVDFPMFERDETNGKIIFSHNPFSMPQGEMDVLENLASSDPLAILAQQYDIVCNGVELSSGAIRNHRPDIMYKAFAIAGYSKAEVDKAFPAMLNAFRYGVPPHGGSAPGVDRIVMLLARAENIREVVAFPMNQKAEDLMMSAPAAVDEAHLRLLGLRLIEPSKGEQGKGESSEG